MRTADRVAGAVLLATGVAFSAGALKFYEYSGPGGPGPAFLPFWLGVVMVVLATLLLIGALRSREPGERWLPEAEGLRRIGVVLALTFAFIALLKWVGMIVGTALFLIALLRSTGRLAWPLTLAVACGTAGLIHLVFGVWLRVPFPVSIFGI